VRPEWKYSQEFYFEPRSGGEVRIFGLNNHKQTNKTHIHLVGTQEELRSPSGYTPRGFSSTPEREAK